MTPPEKRWYVKKRILEVLNLPEGGGREGKMTDLEIRKVSEYEGWRKRG